MSFSESIKSSKRHRHHHKHKKNYEEPPDPAKNLGKSGASIYQTQSTVPSDIEESTINPDDIGDDDDLVLEEEVLPYESIFEWDMQDALGFYREIQRYNKIREEFEDDPLKTVVIDGMWRDREKYQVLRRFMWPPSSCFGVFYSRGYYEDYQSRPTVNVADMATATRKLKEERIKKKKHFSRTRGKIITADPDDD